MSNHPHSSAVDIVCGPADAVDTAVPVGSLQKSERSVPVRLEGLLRTARPRQWVKNALVFAAPGMAGVLTNPGAVATAFGAFGVFCLAASGSYFLNDAMGVEADRLHPAKSRRPVATGEVDVGVAKVLGASMLVTSMALAQALAGWRLAAVVTAYVAVQPVYSAWLRSVPVAELATVASGFVLRAVAGGVAVGVPISHWFLIVTSFGSLFLVSGKRTAEHIDLGEQRGNHRSTLGRYSLRFLHHLRTGAASVAVAAYCLWAFEKAGLAPGAVWFQISIVPFVLLVLRYALLLDAGRGGSPEDLVFEDRALQALALVWVTLVAVGVHAG